MPTIVMICGGFIVLVGLATMLVPSRVATLIESGKSKGGMAFGAGIRITLGVALWFSAPGTGDPQLLRVLGVVFVVAGLLVPVLGVKRVSQLLEWFQGLPEGYVRVWGLAALMLGAWLIYLVW